MLNNFHEIKAVISNSQRFKASFYGIAEYIHGMINNRIKFKNIALQSKLYFIAKIKDNSVKIENSKLYTTLLSVLKPKENVIRFADEIKTRLISIVRLKDTSKIVFLDKPLQKLNILFSPKINENEFSFQNNDSKINVALQGRINVNNILIDNNNKEGTHSTVSLIGDVGDNKFSFTNGTVNAATWKFLTLGDISGTLNEIEKSPLEYLGRRKIVQ